MKADIVPADIAHANAKAEASSDLRWGFAQYVAWPARLHCDVTCVSSQ